MRNTWMILMVALALALSAGPVTMALAQQGDDDSSGDDDSAGDDDAADDDSAADDDDSAGDGGGGCNCENNIAAGGLAGSAPAAAGVGLAMLGLALRRRR